MDRSGGLGRIVRGRAIVILGIVGASGCENGTGPALALRLEAVTPTALTGTVGQSVIPTPTVLVTAEHGAPLKGVTVSFMVLEGHGWIEFPQYTTSSGGRASVGTWTLGRNMGTVSLRAQAGGQTVLFHATAEAGAPEMIWLVGGEGQMADAGAAVPAPLTAWVVDRFQNGVDEAQVTFEVISGGGAVTPGSTKSHDVGTAEAWWTLGPSAGVQQVEVKAGIAEAVFTAFAPCGDGGDPCGTVVPPAGRIAFVSDRDGNAEIYSVDADGSDMRRLTDSAGRDTSPAWSPDGTHIAFSSDRSGASEIYTMKADGSEVLQQTSSGLGAYDPAWSPDGAMIVYSTLDMGHLNLWALFLDSEQGPERLFARQGQNREPAWAPDGMRVAFVSDWNAFDIVSDIYLVNADGSDAEAITGDIFDGVDYTGPSWSPDGQRLSVATSRGIVVMAADGSEVVPLVPSRTATGPSWSPDGTRIAFATGRGIAWIKVDGGGAGIIVEDGRSPSWGP